MIPNEHVDKLLNVRDVQVLVDIMPLLQELSALERVHEDRSLPTMALVIGTVVKFVTTVRSFVEAARHDLLRTYGNAILDKARQYFAVCTQTC